MAFLFLPIERAGQAGGGGGSGGASSLMKCFVYPRRLD